ncbi:MAG TPA: carboxylating nicotinate-nucleotide diphosphorylase [Gemmatimonadales bacterium]|nr:carboxylating nicotinate-nucleotide diphosphorylase [Gemmatimonadales bacterium]
MSADVARVAALALEEDGGTDVTTAVTVPPGLQAEGVIEYRSGGVLAGAAWADAVARACDCRVEWRAADGREVRAGAAVGLVHGSLARILRAERPMLNLLQRACGIASATRAYVDVVAGTRCRVLHTRKTAPGLRALDIAAVLAGGGARHRTDLSHEVMIKDNHWRALARSGTTLAAALEQARRKGISALQVEAESPAQLAEACAAGATRLLVDNQTPETVALWGERARALRPGIEIEATGGITLANVRAYAEAGADFVSVGALTHSVRAPDLAIEVRVLD